MVDTLLNRVDLIKDTMTSLYGRLAIFKQVFKVTMGFFIQKASYRISYLLCPRCLTFLAVSRLPKKFMPQSTWHMSDAVGQTCYILMMFWTHQTQIKQSLTIAGGDLSGNTGTTLGE